MPSEVSKILEKQFVVTEREAIQFMGPDVPHVLATPALVKWMEVTAREHVAPLLNPGEDTVGISMHVEHLAPTPVGMGVRVVSTLASVAGRVFGFEIEAFDEAEKVGKATHQRASVVVAKFTGRVAAKKEKAERGR
jgi:predicted thioesterase